MNTNLLTIYISKSLERFLTYFAKCVSINEHINGSYTKTAEPNLINFSELFVLIYYYNMCKFQIASYHKTGGIGGVGAPLKQLKFAVTLSMFLYFHVSKVYLEILIQNLSWQIIHQNLRNSLYFLNSKSSLTYM